MTLTPITIVLLGVLLLLAVVTPMVNPLFRRPDTSKPDVPDSDRPRVSILIVARGKPTALDEHLPIYLTQEYAPGYEVIVVADKSDDDTLNVLKRYSGHELLYSTYIPDSSRYMSKNKLGVTLGVKAASNDWIIMVDASCKPDGSRWLHALTSGCASGNNMVLGYTHFSDSAPRVMGFEHLVNACYLLRSVQVGRPFRTNCGVLAFRKSEFMKGNGFQGNLKYTIGEYDFLVNKFGKSGSTVAVCDAESWLSEDPPSRRGWQNRKVYYQEVRKHLRRGHQLQLSYICDELALHVNYLSESCGIAWGILSRDWLLMSGAVISVLITMVLRTRIGLRACRAMGARVSWYQLVPFEISLIYRKLMTMIRYEYADKSDFISQKV